jgi:hypothetical protein
MWGEVGVDCMCDQYHSSRGKIGMFRYSSFIYCAQIISVQVEIQINQKNQKAKLNLKP